MTDKLPPQWAIDKAIELFGEDEYTGHLNAAAILIVNERERCAKICERHGSRHKKWELALACDLLIDAAYDIRCEDVD